MRRGLGGELHLALAGGFDPERIYMHGNNKTQAELDYALERRRGPHRASTRSTRSTGSRAAGSACCCA